MHAYDFLAILELVSGLDTAICPDQLADLSALELCTADVARWFLENALLLNPTKTEAVLFGTRQRLQAADRTGVREYWPLVLLCLSPTH